MGDAAEMLERVRSKAVVCTDCDLSLSRRNVVFGEGSPEAELLFIGEGPGEVEDETGRPFVGRAGVLLDEVLQENGIKREDVYITNVIKCRAFTTTGGRAKNRPPRVGEVNACRKWLQSQLDIMKPRVIICVGTCRKTNNT
jgi:DNA polymerase